MKTTSLMYHKGGFVKATPDDLHRVLAIPFRAMKGSRRSTSAQCASDDAGSWVLEMLSGLAWMG
jgi:hypothetical protein